MKDPTFMAAQVVRVSEKIVSVDECVAGGDEENGVLVVVSFYKFSDFPDHADLRKPLKKLCQDLVTNFGLCLLLWSLLNDFVFGILDFMSEK